MRTQTSKLIRADLEVIYRLAFEVERWPAFLPHYRWVRVLADLGTYRVVEMAAHRDGIPVWWRAEQRRRTDPHRVEYRHIQGITTGMEVRWGFDVTPEGVIVTVRHELDLDWPVIGRFVADRVIGSLFVENIAEKTLRRIKTVAELGVAEVPMPVTGANRSKQGGGRLA